MTAAELKEVKPVGTLADQMACVKRELAMRYNVYPRFIESGKLKPETAVKEVSTMLAVLRSLEELEDLQANGKKAEPDANPTLDLFSTL